MDLAEQDVPGLLTRSRLFTTDEARAVYQRWLDETNDDGELDVFMRWLAERRYVTEYQAKLLSGGHSEGFFLHDYKILERIGRGRMAGVYKAVHRLGQTVALKVLPPSRSKEPELLARFQREARLALRLKHPNVVRGYQMGEADGCYYLVMEYLVGETLADLFQRRSRLPHQEALHLVHQLLLGLEHMHEQGFVHRDIKPANIMLVPAGSSDGADGTNSTLTATLKILDIGLARVLVDESVSNQEDNPLLTSAGVVLGTPDYMAPEQARDARSADIRADIYSAGCVLYHALTGQPPFPDTNLISQMVRHATEPARLLREFEISAPEGLQQILDRMLAKDPEDRYPTPESAAQALHVFLTTGVELAVSPETDPQMTLYLNWLDTENANPPPPSVASVPQLASSRDTDSSVATTPAPKKRQTKVDVRPAIAPASSRGEDRLASAPSLSRSVRIRPKPTPVPQERPAEPALPVEVELVQPTTTPQARGLTRRDLIMLGAGAGGAFGAVLLGWGVSLFLKSK
jgi:serine/threonine protein kinase